MAIQVPRALVEFVLLGPEDDRRQLQDSPILGDVWVEFAKTPGASLELLITPFKEKPAGMVANELSECNEIKDADIAYLQGIIAARLSFEEVLRCVVPMSAWWRDTRIKGTITSYISKPKEMETDIGLILDAYAAWLKDKKSGAGMQDLETRRRFIALTGLILWAEQQTEGAGDNLEEKRFTKVIAPSVVARLTGVFLNLRDYEEGLVWTVSLNRRANAAVTKSVPAVKADAARTLFTVKCEEIVWAVVDSGIDATHDAFKGKDKTPTGKHRIKKSFDFTNIRKIVSLDNTKPLRAKARLDELLKSDLQLKNAPTREEAEKNLEELAAGAKKGRSIDWELVERLVEINPEKRPPTNHGTHVAGILGAAKNKDDGDNNTEFVDGMCPDILLYDFRVLAPTLKETEFAIIAALQYIRYINERNSYITIHGANLSLSIPHDVRNYACGRTPICNECERLVNSGVVVVAAAGNRGYQNYETKEGMYEGYAAFSVTDPGNADGVITVGATHRYWPHTYGVSFFSSRGPTGDGRLKPDLVAPGERIRAPLPDNQWGDLDGTSMAAPHVSGAAAMLMARYSELIGQPRRIKKILCESATDLGRERSFQGHGMLDVLRAFQSI